MANRMRLGDLLVQKGHITQGDLNRALAAQKADPRRPLLGVTMLGLGIISRDGLISALSSQLDILADEGLLHISSGQDSLAKMSNATNTFTESVESMGDQADALERSTKKIGVILEFINDVARNTNLLAINASIEAARAGEQGRGFGVVADEVRRLAANSMESTGRIEDVISEIHSETAATTQAVTRALEAVTHNSEVIAEAIKEITELRDIVGETQFAAKNISQLTAARPEGG